MIIGRERELRYETDIGWIQTYYHKGLSSRIQPDSLQQPRLTYARNIAEMLHISFIPFGLQYNNQEIGRAHGLNSSHITISYAVFCLKKKTHQTTTTFLQLSTH